MKLLNEYKYKIPKIWFYEIKGVQDVVTEEEIKTAKKLSDLRSKVFLETRAYLRQSLSTLFDLDPIKIPLNAQPGEPPSLPPGMGNISLSHCKDAVLIVWHKEKIGIDIERTDRNFNHIKIAEKYFLYTNKSSYINKLTKTMILNQWCAVEAAIKWDHGKISKDIKHWEYFEKSKELIHQRRNIHLNYSIINFHKWTIALAYEEKNSLSPEMICCSKSF
ncbi:4-phosphopantetheinyl transferase [Prochlorococcus marinus str. MU1404]|uniref:4'-phosphopantetheinyl transferase family protein n=1 Tax=Prochlorococcus marinus TaxID=1219 RepID=UPI001ADA5A12|nr:4-phosphopantetheinyl transferase [Prochlorococcus marinus]MBO8229247.1 4-phosphopantetheinyl transferase [Prochlorococcus marinus XMU1404]MBW3072331.1 4-phosphopantetheinyl transferase [Prochlorococcus marinus str. MU1404]MCR8544570.1 4-phosphopantetheinyl transferase [Prochlorococcus marinus CUG1432]